MDKTLLDVYLDKIGKILTDKATAVDKIGLEYGSTGILLFLYAYARYSGKEAYEEWADRILDNVFDMMCKWGSLEYVDGLTGFGTAVEYFAANGYLDPDTDDVLADIDMMVIWKIKEDMPGTDYYGLGKYLVARIASANSCEEYRGRNLDTVEYMAERNWKKYGSYTEVLGAVDYLKDAAAHSSGLRSKLDDALAQLDDMVAGDWARGCYPSLFNPLSVAIKLVQAGEKVSEEYTERAREMISVYEKDFRRYLGGESYGMVSGSFKWSVLYDYLGGKLGMAELVEEGERWLVRSLEKEYLFEDGYDGMPSMGILDGYAGIGYSLLYHADDSCRGIMDVVPVFKERGKVTFSGI